MSRFSVNFHLFVAQSYYTVWLQKTKYFTQVTWTAFMVLLSHFWSLKAFKLHQKKPYPFGLTPGGETDWIFSLGGTVPFTYHCTHLLYCAVSRYILQILSIEWIQRNVILYYISCVAFRSPLTTRLWRDSKNPCLSFIWSTRRPC